MGLLAAVMDAVVVACNCCWSKSRTKGRPCYNDVNGGWLRRNSLMWGWLCVCWPVWSLLLLDAS